MNLVENYLYLIRQQLPLRVRYDITSELRSLLLDDIEHRFGSDADNDQVMEVLKSFGNPYEVAKRYSDFRPVIAPVLADLYFLLLKVILGALSLAFLIMTIIGAFQGELYEGGVLGGVLFFLKHLIPAYLSATGIVTLGFIGATRLPAVSERIAKGEDWSFDELKDVDIDNHDTSPSIKEGILILIGVLAFGTMIHSFPHVTTALEEILLQNGIRIEHRLAVDVFLQYMRILVLLWAGSILSGMLFLRKKTNSVLSTVVEHTFKIATLLLFYRMVSDYNLYTDYTGLIGFRIVFIAAAVILTVEFILTSMKAAYKKFYQKEVYIGQHSI
ncbi:MAG: hypothetical protein ACLFVQ_06530 [Chitinispirillaceae bacterium]